MCGLNTGICIRINGKNHKTHGTIAATNGCDPAIQVREFFPSIAFVIRFQNQAAAPIVAAVISKYKQRVPVLENTSQIDRGPGNL